MSCRYQPDYRGDADYRGQAGLLTEPCLDFTFDLVDGIYVPSPVWPRLDPLDRIGAVECDETITDITISDSSPHSFYRTTSLTTNQGYKSRLFTTTLEEGQHSIVLSNVEGFNPYVIVHRSTSTEWRGVPNGDGDFVFDVTSDQTGPAIIEVTTLNRHEQGSFDIRFDCHSDIINCPVNAFDPFVEELGIRYLKKTISGELTSDVVTNIGYNITNHKILSGYVELDEDGTVITNTLQIEIFHQIYDNTPTLIYDEHSFTPIDMGVVLLNDDIFLSYGFPPMSLREFLEPGETSPDSTHHEKVGSVHETVDENILNSDFAYFIELSNPCVDE